MVLPTMAATTVAKAATVATAATDRADHRSDRPITCSTSKRSTAAKTFKRVSSRSPGADKLSATADNFAPYGPTSVGTPREVKTIMKSWMLVLMSTACVSTAPADPVSTETTAAKFHPAYAGSLGYVFCDLKRPLAGIATPSLDESNYRAVIDGFKTNLGCNGIRVYIDPAIADPTTYPPLYLETIHYARARGLAIYANPLDTGSFGMDDTTYAAWIAAYANTFEPFFLGPFNESGLSVADLQTITQTVRSQLHYSPTLVGPDKQHITDSIAVVPKLVGTFDIFGSHDANGDTAATTTAWDQLDGGWATENPRSWSETNVAGDEIGVSAVVASSIQGLVLYLAFPHDVAADGSLTPKGQAIAAGLRKPPTTMCNGVSC
jgi:hypothetical protein